MQVQDVHVENRVCILSSSCVLDKASSASKIVNILFANLATFFFVRT